jgi:hypothetical protein
MSKKRALRRHGDAPWEVEIDVKAVTDAIGADTLANFYRVYVAVDRIVSLEHLLALNAQHVKPDSQASERNLHHLVLMLAGAMYEIGTVLQGLTSNKFGAKLPKYKSWAPLDEMRKKWHNEPFASRIRNGFAFHFGEPEAYRAGIEKGPPSAVLERGDSDLLFDSRVVEPLDALLRHEIPDDDDAELRAFLKRTRDAHAVVSTLVRELFFEVLADHGLL